MSSSHCANIRSGEATPRRLLFTRGSSVRAARRPMASPLKSKGPCGNRQLNGRCSFYLTPRPRSVMATGWQSRRSRLSKRRRTRMASWTCACSTMVRTAWTLTATFWFGRGRVASGARSEIHDAEAGCPSDPHFGMAVDVEGAHRTIAVRPLDWPLQACPVYPDGQVFLNRRGTFGLASAAYWWGYPPVGSPYPWEPPPALGAPLR